MKLTARQQEILDYLQAEHRRTGIMPSTREIQTHFGFASQTAAVSHLRAQSKLLYLSGFLLSRSIYNFYAHIETAVVFNR